MYGFIERALNYAHKKYTGFRMGKGVREMIMEHIARPIHKKKFCYAKLDIRRLLKFCNQEDMACLHCDRGALWTEEKREPQIYYNDYGDSLDIKHKHTLITFPDLGAQHIFVEYKQLLDSFLPLARSRNFIGHKHMRNTYFVGDPLHLVVVHN